MEIPAIPNESFMIIIGIIKLTMRILPMQKTHRGVVEVSSATAFRNLKTTQRVSFLRHDPMIAYV